MTDAADISRRRTASGSPTLRAGAVELAATLGKALVAIGVFFTITSGFAQLRPDGPAAQPLPNSVDARCALWFVGSSSISRWTTLERDMSPWTAHNRSISGATLTELSGRFAVERSPEPPRAIVFYAGENDMAYGVPDATVLKEFRTFLGRKTAVLGRVPVFFISVKPSPTRWDRRRNQARLNDAVRRLAAGHDDLHYVDIVPDMLRGGRPGPFFDPDGIHMNGAGYAIWARSIRGALRAGLPAELVRSCEHDG